MQLSSVPSLQRGAVSSRDLAGVLFSSRWLDDTTLDAILDTVRQEMATTDVSGHVEIANSMLAYQVSKGFVNGSTSTYWGERLRHQKIRKLLMPCNLSNVHWIAVEVDVASGFINVGDSKPLRRLENATEQVISGLKRWLKIYLPKHKWAINKNGLSVNLQQDGHSCGIAVASTIHKRIIPSAAAWSPKKPFQSRALYYIRCIAMGSEVSSS